MIQSTFRTFAKWLLPLLFLLMAEMAQAAIAFRAVASASLASGVGISPALISRTNNDAGASGATSLLINNPGSVLAGHVLVAQLAFKGGSATVGSITPPTGWTLVDASSSSGADRVTQAVYWKLAGAAEPASYTWSWSNSVRAEGGIAAFGNVDVLNPVDSWGVRANNNTATITLPTITFNSTNVMLVAALTSSQTTTHTTPTGGMNEQYDSSTGAGPNGVTASLATLAQVTTATSGARTASSGQAVDNIAHLLALRAAGAALTINVPAGTTAGDVMIASITMRSCSATNNGACTTSVTAPAGWSLVRQMQTRTGGGTDGYGSQLWVYQRVVTGAEPLSYTWFFGGWPQQAGAAGGILTFSGADTASPLVAEDGQATASARSHGTPSINTGTVANTMLVASFGANSAANWTPPTGMTERADRASRTTPDDLGVSLEIATQLQAAAGAVAAKTATYTGTQPTGDTGVTHLLALRPAPVGPDHYELSLSTDSVSCLASTVTVTACANASSPCTSAYAAASGYTATLSTSGATLGATTVTFNASGVATTTLNYPSAADGTSAAVTLAGESLSAVNLRQCCADGVTCSVANSCTTTFKTAAFIFADAVGGAQVTIPAQTAGTTAVTAVPGPYYLRAVKTNTTTRACEAALSGTSSVNLGYQCNNPATCSSGNFLDITPYSGAVAQATQTVAPGGTALALYFDVNGNAPLTFNYRDVGSITLTAGKAAGGSLLSALSGDSNPFVVRPGGFVLSNIRQTAAPQLANPAAANAAGGVFVKAGESFSVTVTATTSAGATTPNYGLEATPEGVLLTPVLVQPAGGNTGVLANASIGGAGVFANGVATVSNLSWGEVGIMTLTPRVGDGDYLGVGDVAGTTTGNVGRFYPAQFSISAASLTPACVPGAPATSFTYFGEDGFTTAFTLTAQNLTGGTTSNYRDAFAKLDLALYGSYGFSAAALPAGSSLSGSTSAPSGSWTNGVATVTARHQISRPTDLTAPTSAALTAAPTDGEVPAASPAMALGTTTLRYGRLQLLNAYGSELLDLPLTLRAQYWNGSAWVVNSDDSCTAITAPTSGSGLTFYPEVATGAPGNHLSAAETTAMVNVTGKLASGDAGLRFSKPGSGNSGYVDISIPLAVRPWLQYSWGVSAVNPTGLNPTGRATFGIYRSRLIYSRENY